MSDAFGELEPLSERPEYRDRDAKIDLLTKQNLDGCLLFPTLGVGMESALGMTYQHYKLPSPF